VKRRMVAFAALVSVVASVVVIGFETAAVAAPVIASVKVGGTQSSPIVTVNGSGFGTLASLGSPTSPDPSCGPRTGSMYGSNFYFRDETRLWEAGNAPDFNCIGVIISSYTDNKIVFSFGNEYSIFGYILAAGDTITMHVLGQSAFAEAPVVVPKKSAPVSTTVTVNEDAAWTVVITNPYSTPLTSVSLSAAALVDGTQTGFNESKMPGCSPTGTGTTCNLPSIPAGGSSSFTLFAETLGSGAGSTVTGSIDLSATGLLTNTTGLLDTVTIVACGSACVVAVASPGTPVASSPGPPNAFNPTKQVVTLPGNKPGAPPVKVTLKSEKPGPSSPPRSKLLCPTKTPCKGQISLVGGSFKKYVDRAHPIKVQVIALWGKKIPAGKLLMLKDSGPPIQLATCVKKSGKYNTPCAQPDKVTGTAAANNLTTSTTVFFVGIDPRFARHVNPGPDAPPAVKAVAGVKKATLTWKAPVVTNGRITGYVITPRIGSAVKPKVSVGAVLKATVSGLVKGKTYTFTLIARNAQGVSLPSKASNAIKVK
jgi:hypothetical protein